MISALEIGFALSAGLLLVLGCASLRPKPAPVRIRDARRRRPNA